VPSKGDILIESGLAEVVPNLWLAIGGYAGPVLVYQLPGFDSSELPELWLWMAGDDLEKGDQRIWGGIVRLVESGRRGLDLLGIG